MTNEPLWNEWVEPFDVFISYARVDNEPPRMVSAFVELLAGIGLAAQPREARVADYREKPGPAVATVKAVKESKGAQVSFLNEIFRVLLVASQPAGQIVRSVQVRNHGLLEECAFSRFIHQLADDILPSRSTSK